MKKLLIVLVTLAATSALAQDNPKYLNVLAVNGLNMRSQAESTARVLTKIPYGNKVEIIEQTKDQLQLGWIKDHWYLVRFRGREGYVFGGYLSTLPAPENLDSVSQLSQLLPLYCVQSFQPAGEIIRSNEETRIGYAIQHSLLKFTNGFELEMENQAERNTALILMNTDVQAAYILLEALLKSSGKDKLLDDLRFVRDKNNELQRVSTAVGSISIKRISDETVELKLSSFASEN